MGITSCAIMFDIIWWSTNQAIFEVVSPDTLKITIPTTWTHPQLGWFKGGRKWANAPFKKKKNPAFCPISQTN